MWTEPFWLGVGSDGSRLWRLWYKYMTVGVVLFAVSLCVAVSLCDAVSRCVAVSQGVKLTTHHHLAPR